MVRKIMTNVVLIGFMGSGKTVVGRSLARLLDYKFIDVDELVEKKTGQTINQIFEEQGEPVFRELESGVIAGVALAEGQVISCGGGAVLDSRNVEALKQNGLLVYLKASPERLYQRVKNKNLRPLLNVSDPQKRLKELLEQREKVYQEVADLVIDTTNLTVDQTVADLEKQLKGKSGGSR